MTLEYRTQPLTDQTWVTGRRKPTPFRASWSATLDLLARELEHLKAREVVVELDILAGDIRRDGRPRANAKVGSPAVRLMFETADHGALSYACDQYVGRYHSDPADWQINLRAIGLTLEALRAVDRYGASAGEQYAGYAALAAGSGAPASGMTATEAHDLIWRESGGRAFGGNDVAIEDRLERARRRHHPDLHGGDHDMWWKLADAAKTLRIE